MLRANSIWEEPAPCSRVTIDTGSLQLPHTLNETTDWGCANNTSQLHLPCDFQPRSVWGRMGTLSPCFKKTAVRGTGHCWHQGGGTNLRVQRRAFAFSGEIRLLQKRLGWGNISTVTVGANLGEKVVSALRHLQEEQGELEWVQHLRHSLWGLRGCLNLHLGASLGIYSHVSYKPK